MKNKKSKKLIEQKNRWSCTNNFYKKTLTGAIFLLAPAANHGWYKPFFYWLIEMAVCCYFGADLGNGLDYYSHSRLADVIPHSSSDLLYFILSSLLLGKIILSPTPFLPFAFLGKKFLSPNFSSLFSSDKNFLSPTSVLQKHSKTIPNSVWAAKSLQFYKKILKPIFYLT